MERNFRDLLEAQWDAGKFLCVGLDSDFDKIPQSARLDGVRETLIGFNRSIIDATKDIAGAYKPNPAFYEPHGELGWSALQQTIAYIHEVAPDMPVILDAKRADIGNTNSGYATSAFENLNADAITVHPYMGSESLAPFFAWKDRGIIVLCRTSNPGAGEIQDLKVDGEPLYRVVARLLASKWNTNGNCCAMVGATYPDELREVRAIVGDMPILIAGIGAQDGDLEKTVRSGKDKRKRGMIINVSRSIIFASSGGDFAGAARAKATVFDGAIRAALVA